MESYRLLVFKQLINIYCQLWIGHRDSKLKIQDSVYSVFIWQYTTPGRHQDNITTLQAGSGYLHILSGRFRIASNLVRQVQDSFTSHRDTTQCSFLHTSLHVVIFVSILSPSGSQMKWPSFTFTLLDNLVIFSFTYRCMVISI